MIGRDGSLDEHPPVRRAPRPCAYRAACSLLASTDRGCGDRCPLEAACRGATDVDFATLREPLHDTHVY